MAARALGKSEVECIVNFNAEGRMLEGQKFDYGGRHRLAR
jgi:hypothetical protein